MATQPSLRIGDRQREAVAAELREHFAHGRLTLEEFNHRLDAAFAAKTEAELEKLTADLPHVRGLGTLPAAGSAAPIPRATRDWSGSGGARYHYRSRRGRLAGLATLLALLASWLIVFDFMAAFRFPLPGRLGMLLAFFAVIRGLLRWIFGGSRGRPGRPW